MKTLVVTVQENELVATIFEHEEKDESAKNDIIERLKGCNICIKIDIDGFSYIQYKNQTNGHEKSEAISPA